MRTPPKPIILNPEDSEVVQYIKTLKRLFDEYYPNPTLTNIVNEIKFVKKILYDDGIVDKIAFKKWLMRFDINDIEASNLKQCHELHTKTPFYQYEYYSRGNVNEKIIEYHSHIYAFAFQEYLMFLYNTRSTFIETVSGDKTKKISSKKKNDDIDVIDPFYEKAAATQKKRYMIIPDKILGELQILDHLVRVQVLEHDKSEESCHFVRDMREKPILVFPVLNDIYVYSKIELFNISEFKEHVTKRFENAVRDSLLFNQMYHIKKNAQNILDFYHKNVGPDSQARKQFSDKFSEIIKRGNEKLREKFLDQHIATINIHAYHFSEIYLGYFGFPEWASVKKEDYDYYYSLENESIKNICFTLVSFIDSLGIDQGNSKVKSDEKSEISSAKIPHLTLRQIALFCFYKGRAVTRENGNEIVREYGLNSGEKLFHHYSHYSSRQNRIAREDTHKKCLNKIVLFETVINLLDKNSLEKQKASEDLNTLKSAIAKED